MTKWGTLEKETANHFSILAFITPWTVWKDKKDRKLKDELPRSIGATGDQWRNNFRKNERWSQSNNTHLWMLLVMEARSNAVKSNIA